MVPAAVLTGTPVPAATSLPRESRWSPAGARATQPLRDPAAWAVVASLLLWLSPLTRASGGRAGLTLTACLVLLFPALAVVRPWRRVGALDLVAFAPAAAALLACFVAPTGFDALVGVASYAYAALLFVLVRGYLLGGGRAGLVVGVLMLGALDQFATSWWSWYGGQQSASLMVGTFYWHNQFAVYMAALGILGAAVLARGSGRVRWFAGLGLVLAVPSLAFAGSRATLVLFVLAWAVLAVVSARRPRALVPLVAASLLGLGLTAGLASPLLMAHSSGISANVEQRESALGNGSARLVYDRVAVDLVARHPLTGTGFGSFADASSPLMPTNLQPTDAVHDGYLQAFVDGGVALGIAVGVVALLPLAIGARRLRRHRLGRRGDTADAVLVGSVLALGVLALHSAVDFDWTYPSLVALYAVLAALAVTRARQAPGAPTATPVPTDRSVALTPSGVGPVAPPRRSRTALVALVVVATALVVALPAAVRTSAVDAPDQAVPTWAHVAALGVPVGRDVPAWLRGTTTCQAELRGEFGVLPAAQVDSALTCTARAAADSPALQLIRAGALLHLGRAAQASALAAATVARYGARIPQLVVSAAMLPVDSSSAPTPAAVASARAGLHRAIADPRVSSDPAALLYAQQSLASLDGLDPVTAGAAK